MKLIEYAQHNFEYQLAVKNHWKTIENQISWILSKGVASINKNNWKVIMKFSNDPFHPFSTREEYTEKHLREDSSLGDHLTIPEFYKGKDIFITGKKWRKLSFELE